MLTKRLVVLELKLETSKNCCIISYCLWIGAGSKKSILVTVLWVIVCQATLKSVNMNQKVLLKAGAYLRRSGLGTATTKPDLLGYNNIKVCKLTLELNVIWVSVCEELALIASLCQAADEQDVFFP